MPRNTAEYIQASSRVGRSTYGLVLTVHHPFRARDISHYEKFIEFHEKMYSYVEPISITPFTKKAIQRYLGLYLATMLRHTSRFVDRASAQDISNLSDPALKELITKLTKYFEDRKARSHQFEHQIRNILKDEDIHEIKMWIEQAFEEWKKLYESLDPATDLVFNYKSNSSHQQRKQEQLYVDINEYHENIQNKKWQIPMSLRVIESESAIKINPI